MLDEIGIAGSRKRIPDFALRRPRSLDEAVAFLRGAGPSEIMIHAGGLDVTNRLKLAPHVRTIVHLNGLPDLARISCGGDRLEIGATATHADIVRHPAIVKSHPDFARYVGGLGNVRVRIQGTIGGNLMSRDPNYEMLPALAVLDATLNLLNPMNSSLVAVAARDWPARGAAFARHLLTSISIPLQSTSLVWFRELRPALGLVVGLQRRDDAILSACAALTGDRTGVVVRPYHPGPTTRADLAAALPDHTAMWANRFPDVETPHGPDADYCRRVLAVWLRRAMTALLGLPR